MTEQTPELPWSAIVKFLGPVDLVACTMVSKTVRKVAGRKLNTSVPPPTLAQQMIFEDFLENPESFEQKFVASNPAVINCCFERKYAGPLRGREIQKMRDSLLKNIVLLKYEKMDESENSAVAIIDNEGRLLAIYEFNSLQYPCDETHCSCAFPGDSREWSCERCVCSLFFIGMTNSGGACPTHSQAENAWLFQSRSLYWSCTLGDETELDLLDDFDVTAPNYELFRLFQGRLSPPEVAAVLIHALSSDSRSIIGYVEAVYYYFEDIMCEMVGRSFTDHHHYTIMGTAYDEDTFSSLQDWGRELESIEYSEDKKKKKRKRKASQNS